MDASERVRGEALVVLALAALTLLSVMGMPLIDPDEGRNANVAREMLRSGDWILPTLHGLPYLDKPAFLFAAIGASFALLGLNEFAARLPSMLAGVATLLLTYRFARLLFGRSVAWRSVMVLAVAPLFLGFARCVIFDLPLTALVLISWTSMELGRRGGRFGYAGAWGAAGFAVLMKGPIGLILAVVGWMALHLAQPRIGVSGERRARGWPRSFRLEHLFIFAAIVGPWLWMVEARQPGFLRYALLTESFERLTQPTLKRSGPPWYYLPVILLGFLPWCGLLIARTRAIAQAVTHPGATRALVVASLAIFVFFSLSSSKLPGYVVPLLPLLAILTAASAHGLNEREAKRDAFVLAGQLVGIALLALVALALPIIHELKRVPELPRLLPALAIAFGVCGVLGLLAARRGRIGLAWISASFSVPGLLLLGLPTLGEYSNEHGSKALAQAINSAGVPAERVVLDHCYPTGLEFYLDREVKLATEDGRELTSNYIRRNFARMTRGASLLSPQQLEAGLRTGELEVVVSRRGMPPDSSWSELARAGKFRVWRRAPGEVR